MKRYLIALSLIAVLGLTVVLAGCGGGVDETTARQIAQEEAMKAIDKYAASFTPDTMGFGVAWEKQWSYAQGNKVGNMIFVAGQLAHGREVDENGMPKEWFMGTFEEQLRASLDNVKAVLESYGSTMDDVVFLQNFVCTKTRSGNEAGAYNDIAAEIISEYFPKGLQAMTFAEVAGLYGDAQLVESNAIAVVNK